MKMKRLLLAMFLVGGLIIFSIQVSTKGAAARSGSNFSATVAVQAHGPVGSSCYLEVFFGSACSSVSCDDALSKALDVAGEKAFLACGSDFTEVGHTCVSNSSCTP